MKMIVDMLLVLIDLQHTRYDGTDALAILMDALLDSFIGSSY